LNRPLGIASFDEQITVLDGKTMHFLLRVRDTERCAERQGLKGSKHDLRQKAVIQQLFVLSSRLLKRQNPVLSIRNYLVVSLSPGSGVVQFLERTIPDHVSHYSTAVSSKSAFFRYPLSNTVGDEAFNRAVEAFDAASDDYSKNQTAGSQRRSITRSSSV
jgi:hypothetical protein